MRPKSEELEAIYYGCLLVVGPESLSYDGRRITGKAFARSPYLHYVRRFFKEQDLDLNPWDFVNWQRRLHSV